MVGSVFQNPKSQFFNVDTDSELAFACENLGYPQEDILKRIDRTAVSYTHLYFFLNAAEKLLGFV